MALPWRRRRRDEAIYSESEEKFLLELEIPAHRLKHGRDGSQSSLQHRRIIRSRELEEVLAAVVQHKSGERWVVAYPGARNLESDVQYPQGSKTGSISMCLIRWVKDVDQDTEKFKDRRQSILA